MFTHKFHKFQNIETHTNCPDGIKFCPAPARYTSPRNIHHSLHSLVPHGRTMRFEYLPNFQKKSRGIKDTMLDFLLYQVGIEDGS